VNWVSAKKYFLGLDVGGANIKAALVGFLNNRIDTIFTDLQYFPFWEKSIKDFPNVVKKLSSKMLKQFKLNKDDVYKIAVTITAELSDAFQTKKEGVHTILKALMEIFDSNKIMIISNQNIFLNVQNALENYLNVAGANWVASSLFIGSYKPDCILIDAGSTTIDLIPIKDGKPQTIGKDDVSRIMNHELIYTGALRATIPSITHFVPYKGINCRISFEKFALIADVHRILEHITEEEYSCETADNRSKSFNDCYARLSRIICGDIELISKDELISIAEFIYKAQLEIIMDEIQKFMEKFYQRFPKLKKKQLFITTGLGETFLVNTALKNLGYDNIISFSDIVKFPDNIASSAIAVAGALHLFL
jgi:probable H4MPT-linked C1 transfer pathway protein